MFERFNGNVVPFADESTSTNRTVFGSETQSDDIDDNLNSDFKKGWEIVGLNDNPTREDFNAMGYTLGYLTSYLYQNGVAEYNLLQEYKTNSIAIGTDGNIYQSLVDNNIGNALTDTTKWVCIASKNSIVNSIAELKTISNIESINVLGYYEKGDGGGGTFYWDATSTETDNGGTIIQATGITTGRWKRVFSGAVNVKWFGAKGDGATAQDTELQNVINYCSNNKTAMYIPDGKFYFYNLVPKSNVTILGNGDSSILAQIQPTTEIFTGIIFEPHSGEALENFKITNLSLDGNRLSSPAISYNNSIFFRLYNGQATNIEFNNVNFINNQSNAIMFASYSIYGTAKGIKVINCKMNGKNIGNGANTGGDLIRLESVNYSDGNYGQIRFRDIEITSNYAEEIRTLADVKRGCSNFIVSNNITKNMYDCHHSIDGSYNGQVVNNSGEVLSSFSGSGSTFTNFIEVQGENILVANNTGDGAGLVRDGIFVTAYGHPNEPEKTPSNNFGHQSVNVKVHNNNFTNITGTGHRLLQVVNGVCTENLTTNATNYSVSIESGVGGYTDASNVPFVAKANIIDNNKSKNCGLGTAIIKGIDHFIGSNNNEYGQEDVIYSTGMYAKKYNELNLNSTLRLKSTGVANNIENFLSGYYPEAISTFANVINLNYATEINDESTVAQRKAQIGRYTAKQNDIFHFRYWAKAGTNTGQGSAITIDEYDSSNNFLVSSFLGQDNPSVYTEYIKKYKVQNANCAYVTLSLCPGASYSIVTTTGSTIFGNVRVSKNVIGD